MDPRIREHAQIIASHSVDLQSGDHVVIDAPAVATDLVVALHEVIGDAGAHPVTVSQRTGTAARRAYLRAVEAADLETPAHEHALVNAADVYITIKGNDNVTELSDVPPKTQSAFRRAAKPVTDARLGTRWCLTQYPGPGDAQLAGMSTAAYETFVWDAISRDWGSQRDFQAQLVERLAETDEVRIQSGEETDLTMRLGGNPIQNDWGERNLPGGEVFTAPVPASVEGRVHFDLPLYYDGVEITDVRLEFEDGRVVSHAAEANETTLTEILETDDGARRFGELGIGMNRGIDRFTYNMLFDEKMGDTVHLALGRAYEDTVAAGNERNESAVHVDMIVDMSRDARILLDGDVVQENGTFVFED